MAVTSQKIHGDDEQPKARRGPDLSLLLIKVGGWLIVIAVGLLFWLVNGGFSVRGLEAISTQFDAGGKLFWAAIAGIPAPITFAIPGLPPTQPLIPWLGVVGTSAIQIGIVWRARQRLPIYWWLIVLGLVMSTYDLATTIYGFGTLQWAQALGIWAQGLLGIFFTFGLEILIGILLKTKR